MNSEEWVSERGPARRAILAVRDSFERQDALELGLRQFRHDLRRRRYRFRQAVGGVLGAFLVVLARPTWWSFAVGAALITVGAMVRLWAAGHIRKSQHLETHGPYAVVRHPQYLGNSLLAIGLCLAAGHPWAVGIWAVIFYLFYVPAIRREDDKLRRRFRESWQRWYEKTPTIVPTRLPTPNPGLHLLDWSPLQALRNGELIWIALILVGVLSMYLSLM